MIIVTHAMHFASEVADTVLFLVEGEQVEIGPPERLFALLDRLEPDHRASGRQAYAADHAGADTCRSRDLLCDRHCDRPCTPQHR